MINTSQTGHTRADKTKLEAQIRELKRIGLMTKTKVTTSRGKNTPMIKMITRDQGMTATTLTTTEGPKLNPIQEKDPDIGKMIEETHFMIQKKIQPLPKETKKITKRIPIQTLKTIRLLQEEEDVGTN